MSHIRRTLASAFVGVMMLVSTAACATESIQQTGLERPTAGPRPTVSQPSPPSAPSAGATSRPKLKGSAASQSCANLTFSADFRRLFPKEAKFAPLKQEKAAGQGYEVTCVISPAD